MNLHQVDLLWRLRSRLNIEIHTVLHEPLRDFSFSCRDFLRLDESSLQEDYFWRLFAGFIRRLRFDLVATPVSLRYASTNAIARVDEYQRAIQQRRLAYPELSRAAAELLSAAVPLLSSADAPILEHLLSCRLLTSPNKEPVALGVLESRYLGPLRQELLKLELEVVPVTPQMLTGYLTYGRIIFSGPTNWFPDYVITSPRAPEIVFVHFDWLGPDRPPKGLLPGREGSGWTQCGLPTPRFRTPSGRRSVDLPKVLPDIFPTIDWVLLQERAGTTGGEDDRVSFAPARLCLLEGGMGVFLRGHEEGVVLVMTFDHGTAVVRECRVDDLRPGDYVMLRTEGGGDYMVDLAWRILGEKAALVRLAQGRWKRALAERIRQQGLDATSHALKKLGASAANPVNVRAWCSEDRIQPGKSRDFRAVMQLIGHSEKVDEYRRLGHLLRRARVKAGHRIRRLLLQQARDCNLEALAETGKADFRLASGGGEISAFRVIGLAPETMEVPVYRLQDPFRLDESEWLG